MRAAVSKLVSGLLLVLFAGVARAAAITPDPWPREFTTPKGNTAVMYQPQFETFKGDTISGRAAISVTKKGETTPKFGVIFFTASVSVDRDDRSVEIRRIKVNRVRFPNITPEKEKKFAGIVEAEFPKWNLVISYDRALENVKVAEREKKSAQGLKHDPPKVLFAEEPTVLVTLDGEPQLRDVEGAPLKLVVNTALFMVLDTRNNRYYLSGGKRWWYEAPDAKGPWRSIGGPPGDIADLAAQAAEAQRKSDKDVPDGRRHRGGEPAEDPRLDGADRAHRLRGQTLLQARRGRRGRPPLDGEHRERRPPRRADAELLRAPVRPVVPEQDARRRSLDVRAAGRAPRDVREDPAGLGHRRHTRERARHGRGRRRRPRRADPADDGRQARRREARRAVRRRAEVRRDRGHEERSTRSTRRPPS